MTTVWSISNYPITLDSFSPSLVDGVDFVIANHPNTLASAIVAIQGKLGRTGDPITGLGGVSFDPSGKSTNPGVAGSPTIWADNSGGPGFVLKYTDDSGSEYVLAGPGLGSLQAAWAVSDGGVADPSIEIGTSYFSIKSDEAPGDLESIEYQDITLFGSKTYGDNAYNTVIYGGFYYRNNTSTLTKHRVSDGTLVKSVNVTPSLGGIAAIDDKIFVANDADDTVYVYDAFDLSLLDSWSYSGGGSGITVNTTHVFVSVGTPGNHGFEAYTHAGTLAGSANRSTANNAGGQIAVDSTYVYLCNSSLAVVERFLLSGYTYADLVSVTDVGGVVALGDGTFLSSNTAANAIYLYDPSLTLLDTFTVSAPEELTYAGTHLCVDTAGNVSRAYTSFGLKKTLSNAVSKLNGKVVELQDNSMEFPVYPTDILQNMRDLEEIKGSYVTSFKTRVGAVTPVDGDYTADQVRTVNIGTASYDSLQDWMNFAQGRGLVSGGVVTAGSGVVNVTAGVIICKTSDTDGVDTGFVNFGSATSLVLTNNALNYVYVDYNGGSPVVAAGTSDSVLFDNSKVVLDLAYREGSTVKLVNYDYGFNDFNTVVNKRFVESSIGKWLSVFDWANGAILSSAGTLYLFLTAGVFYGGTSRKITGAIDTSSGGSFMEYYLDGVGGFNSLVGITQVNNVFYSDISGSLQPLNDDEYGVHWVYLGFNGADLSVVYGNGSYTLGEAYALTPPTLLPDVLSMFSIRVGKIIVKKNSSTMIVQSAFEDPLVNIPPHNGMVDLQGGSDPLNQYYHLTYSQWSNVFIKNVDDAGDVRLTTGNDSVLTSAQSVFNTYVGRGVVSGFTYSDNLDGTCNIAAGKAFLHTGAAGSSAGFFEVTSSTLINTLVSDFTNYIYFEYNGGSPRVLSTANPTSIINSEDAIIVNIVFRDGTDLHPVNPVTGWRSFISNYTRKSFSEAQGKGNVFATRAYGGIISATGTRNIACTAAEFWAGPNRKDVPAKDTSGADTMYQYYGNTGVGFTKSTGVSQINNTQYFNGTALASLTNNWFTNRYIYQDLSGDDLIVMFGTGQYSSFAAAEAETVPTDVPSLIGSFSILFGRVIVQQGTDTMIVESRWLNDFNFGTVTTHPQLGDKNGEAAYQHVNSTPTSGQTGTQVLESSLKTNSTKKFDVSPQGLTYLYTAEDSPPEFDTFNVCNGEYLFFGERDSHTLHKFDRVSGRILGTVTAASGLGYRSKLIINNEIVVFYGSNIRIINIPLFTIRTVAFSAGSVDSTAGSCINDNGDIFAIQLSTGNVYSIVNSGNDSYSASTLAVSGLVDPRKIVCDNTHYYVLDLDTLYYVKKYDIATNTLQLTSAGFSSPNLFKIIDGEIHLMGSSYYDILNTSLVSVLSTSHSALSGMKYCDECDGIVYGISTTTLAIEAYQSPALAAKTSGVTDLSESKSVKFSENETGLIYTDQDFIRSKQLTDSQNIDRLGCTVLSAETTLPVSPVIGATYLIDGGTTQYDGYVIRWTAQGKWEVLERGTGSRVIIASTGATYDWTGSAWQQVGILTLTQKTDLTDSGDTTLHYHASDRSRSNHTGTQTASTISDFDTEVGNNTDVSSNTSARHTHTNKTTLDTITAGMLLSSTQKTDLTDSGDTTLHYHASDRSRSNHTGTQTASTISDFDTEVENNKIVVANSAAIAGVTVVSVETSLPGSPVNGSWYLLNYGSYYIGHYTTVGGWEYYTPTHGSTVYDLTSDRYWKYDSNRGSWSPEIFDDRVEIFWSGTQTLGATTPAYFVEYSVSDDILQANWETITFKLELNGTMQGESRQYQCEYHGALSYPQSVSDFGGGVLSAADVKIDSMTTHADITSISASSVRVYSLNDATNGGKVRLQLNTVISAPVSPELYIDWHVRLIGFRKTGTGSFC